MPQYALPLSLPTVFSADNFFVSDCNREAWAWVQAWPDWPAHALVVYGPKGSGKSHLGHIWADRAAAARQAPVAGRWPERNLLLEDIERTGDERELLHLLNAARENGRSLLLTSGLPPAQLPLRLPDLTSRLKGLPAVAILAADDAALAGALRKQFADRQMKVEDEVITWLLPRMERSLARAGELVDHLDKAALSERKNITIPFVRRMLEQFS